MQRVKCVLRKLWCDSPTRHADRAEKFIESHRMNKKRVVQKNIASSSRTSKNLARWERRTAQGWGRDAVIMLFKKQIDANAWCCNACSIAMPTWWCDRVTIDRCDECVCLLQNQMSREYATTLTSPAVITNFEWDQGCLQRHTETHLYAHETHHHY